MAVILALGAALSNALTSMLQRSAAAGAPQDSTLRFRLLVYLVRQPVWLLGMATMIAGFALQAMALRFGQLSTVQPLLTTEIVFLLIVMWAWLRVPLGWVEWASGIAIAAGLGVFLVIARPSGGNAAPGLGTWVWASIGGVLAIAVTVFLGRMGVHGGVWKAIWFGSAAAIAFAFAAAALKEAATTLIRSGWTHLLTSWSPYAMAAVGLAGLFLAQNSFHSGPVGASQSALTIVDPLVSILIGVSVFGDKIQAAGWQVVVESVALLVMVAGVLALLRSDVVAGAHLDRRTTELELEKS